MAKLPLLEFQEVHYKLCRQLTMMMSLPIDVIVTWMSYGDIPALGASHGTLHAMGVSSPPPPRSGSLLVAGTQPLKTGDPPPPGGTWQPYFQTTSLISSNYPEGKTGLPTLKGVVLNQLICQVIAACA